MKKYTWIVSRAPNDSGDWFSTIPVLGFQPDYFVVRQVILLADATGAAVNDPNLYYIQCDINPQNSVIAVTAGQTAVANTDAVRIVNPGNAVNVLKPLERGGQVHFLLTRNGTSTVYTLGANQRLAVMLEFVGR